jgi:hypothetical protein
LKNSCCSIIVAILALSIGLDTVQEGHGTSRDLEIQPVPDMPKHNITLDHFDCAISRGQS